MTDKGTVEAFSELCCEVVFHPSYLAPLNAQFALQVHGGASQTLQCSAKVLVFLVVCLSNAMHGTGQIYNHLSLSVCLSFCLSVCVSVCLSVMLTLPFVHSSERSFCLIILKFGT